MKQATKNFVKKLPGIKSMLQICAKLGRKVQALEEENALMARDLISQRLKLKKLNQEPINVVFLCHRPVFWETLSSVYDTMKADPAFKVTIVAIPNKKQQPGLNLNHEIYESEGAEEFWKAESCLNGYNYETGEWLNLRTLEPDYVFFQTPYNICRPPQYHSRVVAKYARICYLSYYGVFYTDEITDECTPLDYMRELYFYFTQSPMDDAYVRNRLRQADAYDARTALTGYPRYDRIERFRNQPCDFWNEEHTFKMVWTPRWTTNEGNCHFFDFKDKIVEYCKNDSGVELVFRPHPQAFKEWNATGELPEAQAAVYKQNFINSNMHLDETNNYYPTLYTSDVLITDRSTILLDYFCTGKPIIYCKSNNLHDGLFPELLEAMYCVDVWEDVLAVITDLRRGIDPLKDVRQKLVQESFVQNGETAGAKIAALIKKG